MEKFRAKSNIVLAALSVLALFAFFAAENGKIDVRQDHFEEKIEAAKIHQLATKTIYNFRMEKGVFVDAVNDPNQTALIGQEYTMITTDRGYLDAKLSSTNPNFSAIIVQLLKEAGVEKGDNVAIAMTGSFPAVNIAVYAAMKTLSLNPITITSVGSSNWGANDPDFTWLDMENLLKKSNVFDYKSVAASIGGGSDIGRGLSPEGRDLIIEAIERNGIPLIREDHLEHSIEKRMDIYNSQSDEKPIKAFINVGGGIASLGNSINGRIIPAGLSPFLPKSNFPVRGAMIQMGQNNIPIIHLLNINNLLKKYGMAINPVPLPDPGEGEIFVQKKYNMVTTSIAAVILIIVILVVYFQERKHQQLGKDVVFDAMEKKNEV
jgi:poly-gamma-glutamate system protein